jgi:hypothetical protein
MLFCSDLEVKYNLKHLRATNNDSAGHGLNTADIPSCSVYRGCYVDVKEQNQCLILRTSVITQR